MPEAELKNCLFAHQVYHAHLDADLVLLSACQTGLGKIAPGEAAVIQDRANELGLLSGDTLPQVLSVEEHVEQLRDYAMASYTLIVDHYTQFTLRSPVPAFLQ